MNASMTPRPAETIPCAVAYDIACPKRARRVRNRLRCWRLDGQYSVHEVRMPLPELQRLLIDVRLQLQPEEDRLVSFRLRQRGGAAIYRLSVAKPNNPLRVQGVAEALPERPAAGHFLLAYDIRDRKRLQRAQRLVARHCAAVQRSLYLYHGDGAQLKALAAALCDVIDPDCDDLRLYPLARPGDLWIWCGALPLLPGFAGRPTLAFNTVELRNCADPAHGCRCGFIRTVRINSHLHSPRLDLIQQH